MFAFLVADVLPILYNRPEKNLLIVTVSFILGMARGYKLFPIFWEMLEKYRVSIQLFFARRSQITSTIKREKLKEQEYRNRVKAEELKRKEEELHRQAEAIKRQQQQAEEELRKAQDRKAKSTTYPNTLQEAFEVLGTQSGLTLEEYKKIWKQEVMKYHPDQHRRAGGKVAKTGGRGNESN